MLACEINGRRFPGGTLDDWNNWVLSRHDPVERRVPFEQECQCGCGGMSKWRVK